MSGTRFPRTIDAYTVDVDGTVHLTDPRVRDSALIALQQRAALSVLAWAVPDPNASPGGAFLPFLNLADLTDLACTPLPLAGNLVAISLVGKPAAGDTITVTPQLCTSKDGAGAVPVTSLAVQITNAAPAVWQSVPIGQADAAFAAGAFLGIKYVTTTGGVYAVRDVGIVLWINTLYPYISP